MIICTKESNQTDTNITVKILLNLAEITLPVESFTRPAIHDSGDSLNAIVRSGFNGLDIHGVRDNL